MPGWIKHKLESRLLGEISTTLDMIFRWHHSNDRKQRGTKESLNESERREWKHWLKTQHSKNYIMPSDPITSWKIDGETIETVTDFTFLGSKITADGDCSHEIKRRLLFGRKSMTNQDSILKGRDITWPKKIRPLNGFSSMVFPVLMYECESCTVKKAEGQRTEAVGLWSWRRRWRVPWTARRPNQSILKEISPE